MRSLHRLCAAAALAIVTSVSSLAAQTPNALQHLKDLARINSLDVQGTQPWHLRMTFQLSNLNGKPQESGTIEEWWVSPQSRRIEIRSPSYNLTEPASPSDPPEPEKHNRESYLVHQLLDQVVHPIPDYSDAKDLKVVEGPRTFGSKLKLDCINVNAANGSSTPSSFCFAPGSAILRVQLGPAQFAAARNTMATFRDVQLGIDNSIAYGNKRAISGHIEKLESYYADGSVKLASPNTVVASTALPGVVMAGRITKKVEPIYPMSARQDHISGSVVLCATISKQGTITGIDVVSSPDQILTDSAVEAVKQWIYQPYLFKGNPVDVDTTITVNYNLIITSPDLPIIP